MLRAESASPGSKFGELTERQEAVADSPVEARILVTAGAGTGKTHVLIDRLARLVERERLSPGCELLVLSFSRAAVKEIRQRLRDVPGSAAYVHAQTFDSYATRLLSEFDPEGGWTKQDYDGRIQAATELLSRDQDIHDFMHSYRHVLIDEIQDLVAGRAQFVEAILKAVGGGFTLFGDPAQGIYNFQLTGEARAAGSAALYAWLRSEFVGSLQECRFETNHRARSEGARVALSFGPQLNSAAPTSPALTRGLRDVLWRLRSLGSLEQAVPALCLPGRSTAILCRTNGQALAVSRALYGYGVPHALKRVGTDRVAPSWIGAVLGPLDQQRLGRQTFMERVDEVVPGLLDPEGAWASLRQIAGGPSDSVDVARLARHIRASDVPDELCELQVADLIVSTIHRAKGLQFERVLLLTDGGDPNDDEEAAEEARLLYVALTRARSELYQVKAPDCSGLRRDRSTDRWVRQFKWFLKDVEVRGRDIHAEDPAGACVIHADPVATQRYLGTAVGPGDPVVLTRCSGYGPDGFRVAYAVEHQGTTVGVTGDSLGRSLSMLLHLERDKEARWPARLKDLHVDAVETVAGSDSAGKRSGVGSTGLWLRPRISGLARVEFDKKGKSTAQ